MESSSMEASHDVLGLLPVLPKHTFLVSAQVLCYGVMLLLLQYTAVEAMLAVLAAMHLYRHHR
jgi:hypothetical protein